MKKIKLIVSIAVCFLGVTACQSSTLPTATSVTLTSTEWVKLIDAVKNMNQTPTTPPAVTTPTTPPVKAEQPKIAQVERPAQPSFLGLISGYLKSTYQIEAGVNDSSVGVDTVGDFARVVVAPGGALVAKYDQGTMRKLWEGQDDMPCSLAKAEQIPQQIYQDCNP